MRIPRSGAVGLGAAVMTLLVAAGQGCQPFAREAPSGWDDAPGDSFVLEVENQNFNEARLYARWNGMRERIGSVVGNRSQNFTLRWRTGDLRVEVDFLAAGGFISDPVVVNPGDTVVFRIPPGAR